MDDWPVELAEGDLVEDDEAVKSPVIEEGVGAFADDKEGEFLRVAVAEQSLQLFDFLDFCEEARRTSDAEGGDLAQGFIDFKL